jgi:hypothetical protein
LAVSRIKNRLFYPMGFEQYVLYLTNAMIDALSIGNSQPETVWFWVKGFLIYRLAVHIVNAFI